MPHTLSRRHHLRLHDVKQPGSNEADAPLGHLFRISAFRLYLPARLFTSRRAVSAKTLPYHPVGLDLNALKCVRPADILQNFLDTLRCVPVVDVSSRQGQTAIFVAKFLWQRKAAYL